MMSINKVFGVIMLVGTLTACGQGGQTSRTRLALQSAEEASTLAFLNDQQHTTFEVLDVQCGLRSDSAANLIAQRDSAPFHSLDDVDAVPMVGPWTLEQLKTCADSFGYTPTPYELAVINFLNDEATDFARLDVDCGLYSNAAANLIAQRDAAPFHSLEEVDSVPQVGPATLTALGQCASDFGFDTGDSDPAPDPQQCTPAAWDGNFDSENYFWDASQAGPELAAVLPALQADAESKRDTSVYFPVRFGDVYEYIVNGQVVHTEVAFVQTIDLEGGIQLWFYYDLDSCLNQTDFWMGI